MSDKITTLDSAAGSDVDEPAGSALVRVMVTRTNDDPIRLATQIAEHIRSGAHSLIAGCELLVEALDRFANEPESRKAFIQALVDKNVIPRRSARLGEFDHSTLSMLRKIGKNAELLRSAALAPYLQPGRSVLYYTVRFYEALGGDHASRMARLIEAFEREGHLTRDFLIARVNELEKQRQPTGQTPHNALPAPGAKIPVDFVVARLNASHRRRLEEHYPTLPRCLRGYENVSNDAIAVVFARLSDLPIVQDRLLPGCGFDSISNVYLMQVPVRADVTHAEVLVVAARGTAANLTGLDTFSGDLDPVSVALRLAPQAKNKLHLFASEEIAGFSCVVGDANWEIVP